MNQLIKRIIQFQARTFGPQRRQGTLAHIRKELVELEVSPNDPEEWVDLGFLALHGLWQTLQDKYPHMSHEDLAEAVTGAFATKLHKNMQRSWPDWSRQDPAKAVEHDRTPAEEQRKQMEAIRAAQNP